MRRLVLLSVIASIALPAFAVKRVTVEQLEQVLTAAHGKSDAKVSQQLSDLELTERLSAADLSRWEAKLPGPESRRSLVVLADLSAFLDPPAAEIPATATPDNGAQRQIMAQVVDYAEQTITKLPDFFATRDTIHFENTPPRLIDTGSPAGSFAPYQPLHPVGRSIATVLYRDGREVVEPEGAQSENQGSAVPGLATSGVFGPILGTVLVDSVHGQMVWSHWERGAAGPLAVFRFAIPREKSHYQVEYCCVSRGHGNGVFRQFSGYHGEIAVDPVTGTILRLVMKADLKPDEPLLRSDIVVEYAPVEIGGRTYICPAKSVSITLAPLEPTNASEMQRYRGELLDNDDQTSRENLQMLLNEAVFGNYHLFRAESRILTGGSAESGSIPLTPPPASAHDSDSVEAGESPVEGAMRESIAAAQPVTPATASTREKPAETESVTPEMSVTESNNVPEPVTAPLVTPDTGFTLHVTTRLVDVSVVAVDKKGHPVSDLKPEEFEIYDNGRKQAVRFFSGPSAEQSKGGNPVSNQTGLVPDKPVFSNRSSNLAGAKQGTDAAETNVTILLIDEEHLVWSDLTYARGEMLRFLRSLPAGEQVGLYVMKASGFEVLEEGTADHALLISQLTQWMPDAQDFALAQEMEQRNRQQFDTVLHQTDLDSVNGNIDTAPDAASGVDPSLRDNGSNPGRSAMAVLTRVARHLGAIPGHKNLIWVTTDNVLVDWTGNAVGVDKGSQHIEGYILQVQEAMNDAHVSIYPLDASQLETAAIDPSLKNRNIELAPSATEAPGPKSGGAMTGRALAEMGQDTHPIQIAIQEMAKATGGQVFRRSGEIAKNLNEVVADGHATYLLSFTPDTPADGEYHSLTVKLTARRGVALRYRTGYEYAREPSTLKERFQQAIWQPSDSSGIGVSATPAAASEGATFKLKIDANDLALRQQGERWVDRLNIFLIQRDDEGLHSRVTGQTLRLELKSATYERLLQDGVPFDQFIEKRAESGSIRILVIDENSGRIGSVTIPAASFNGMNR